ncbi:hypothetical protein [Conexivisphaera calida]|uniref:Uncharacterized protein n=1 Tax=Conexivisphaera calida TaxID=1874277 RepID=A0A4P2VD10_9ARCH|nr:hypothetical protein [Conexivisphaera calida]BBE42424.1 hypothetical protein NAS2_1035 [Conexivisphaera calida]
MEVGGAARVSGDALLHDMVKSWIKECPDEFLRIARLKGWCWTWSRPVFTQTEFRPVRRRKPFRFVDVIIIAEVDDERSGCRGAHRFAIMVEVKTGRFQGDWIEELVRLYELRESIWFGTAQNASDRIIVLVARKSEIEELMRALKVTAERDPDWVPAGLLRGGFLYAIPLERVALAARKDLRAAMEKVEVLSNGRWA